MTSPLEFKKKSLGRIRKNYKNQNYEGRTESHEQQFFCKITYSIIEKPNTPP